MKVGVVYLWKSKQIIWVISIANNGILALMCIILALAVIQTSSIETLKMC